MSQSLFPRVPALLHGADYNPEQWLDRPDILRQDIELMKQAGFNCVSVGIFSWSCLEPEDGVYTLEWLGEILDTLHQNGISAILATPSGARPVWMAKKYPEVLRVGPDLIRNSMGERHNHCYTSPIYRQKVREMNLRLARAFGNHPGVILWHLSNEYGGECFCPLCQDEFRRWLQEKYSSLDELNNAWWTRFWSHSYSDWSQIEAPIPRGEQNVHGLALDWRRFVTDRTINFCEWEKSAVREGGSDLPVTINMMTYFFDLNYFKFKDVVDVISWDSYPEWHNPERDDAAVASDIACYHDLMRCIKQQPFLLMESTPSAINWRPIAKLKKPGMHMLSSMQAVAHGSDSVQYFQWRKSRGSSEKFHGAVVSHDGRNDTRVFNDVAAVGKRLQNLSELCGAMPKPQVAILFDWENWWALSETCGPRKGGMRYPETVLEHYRAFWRMGVPVDIIDMQSELSGYKMLVTPMLYMRRAGIGEKMRRFVEDGGTLVASCFNGMVDENDLCFQGDVPNGMTDVFGLRVEEIDALYDGEYNSMDWNGESYIIKELCERIHLSTAKPLSFYKNDFYSGEAVLCENNFGRGTAYYLAANAEQTFYNDFYQSLIEKLEIEKALDAALPDGVTAALRIGEQPIAIVQNYRPQAVSVSLNAPVQDLESGALYEDILPIEPFGVRFVRK